MEQEISAFSLKHFETFIAVLCTLYLGTVGINLFEKSYEKISRKYKKDFEVINIWKNSNSPKKLLASDLPLIVKILVFGKYLKRAEKLPDIYKDIFVKTGIVSLFLLLYIPFSHLEEVPHPYFSIFLLHLFYLINLVIRSANSCTKIKKDPIRKQFESSDNSNENSSIKKNRKIKVPRFLFRFKNFLFELKNSKRSIAYFVGVLIFIVVLNFFIPSSYLCSVNFIYSPFYHMFLLATLISPIFLLLLMDYINVSYSLVKKEDTIQDLIEIFNEKQAMNIKNIATILN